MNNQSHQSEHQEWKEEPKISQRESKKQNNNNKKTGHIYKELRMREAMDFPQQILEADGTLPFIKKKLLQCLNFIHSQIINPGKGNDQDFFKGM